MKLVKRRRHKNRRRKLSLHLCTEHCNQMWSIIIYCCSLRFHKRFYNSYPQVSVVIDRHPVRFFVHKRPHVDFFLDIVSQWYDLVVFTASMEIYGAAVADKLDNGRNILNRRWGNFHDFHDRFHHWFLSRYYRQHCTPDFGSYTKDLSAICGDLNRIFIIDNSPGAYRRFPNNAIPIKTWISGESNLNAVMFSLLTSRLFRSIGHFSAITFAAFGRSKIHARCALSAFEKFTSASCLLVAHNQLSLSLI